MTRFEELMDIVSRNKSRNKTKKEKELLEVSGLTESNSSEGQGQPHIEYADDQSDGPIVDQLYRSSRHKPLDGSNASY